MSETNFNSNDDYFLSPPHPCGCSPFDEPSSPVANFGMNEEPSPTTIQYISGMELFQVHKRGDDDEKTNSDLTNLSDCLEEQPGERIIGGYKFFNEPTDLTPMPTPLGEEKDSTTDENTNLDAPIAHSVAEIPTATPKSQRVSKRIVTKKGGSNGPRKYKSDSIRKKIKSRTLKKVKNIINIEIKKAGIALCFDYFPQTFVSNIRVDVNKRVLNYNLKELFSTDFGGISKDKEKLRNNIGVLKCLEEHPLISNTALYDILFKCSFRKILEDYFSSDNLKNDIEKLREEGEDEEYVKKYEYLAKNFVKFYDNGGKMP